MFFPVVLKVPAQLQVSSNIRLWSSRSEFTVSKLLLRVRLFVAQIKA